MKINKKQKKSKKNEKIIIHSKIKIQSNSFNSPQDSAKIDSPKKI